MLCGAPHGPARHRSMQGYRHRSADADPPRGATGASFRRDWRRRLGPALAAILALLALASSRPVPTGPLTEASAIRQLSQREAARGQPVQLRGRVTYLDESRRLMTLQDSGGAVRVSLAAGVPRLRMGQLVQAVGTTEAGAATGEVRASRVEVVDASARLPEPKTLSLAALAANPQLDYEWFQMKGTLLGVGQRPNAHPYLDVITPEGPVEVRGSGWHASRLARLAGQQILARGVGHAVRGARGEVLHFEMWLGDSRAIAPLGPAAPGRVEPDTARPALRTMRAIRELSLTEADRGHPVSLTAVITARYDEHALYVQDATGAMYVSNAGDTSGLRAGDRIAIEGTTARGGFSADVVASRIRRLGVEPCRRRPPLRCGNCGGVAAIPAGSGRRARCLGSSAAPASGSSIWRKARAVSPR